MTEIVSGYDPPHENELGCLTTGQVIEGVIYLDPPLFIEPEEQNDDR
jgi:hypothetical protein